MRCLPAVIRLVVFTASFWCALTSASAQDWLKLSPSDLGSEANFSQSLAVVDNYLLVSDRADATNGQRSGAIRIYQIEYDSVRFHQKIVGSHGFRAGTFGWSMGASGNHVLVGAYRENRIYHFKLNGTEFVEVDTLKFPTLELYERVGLQIEVNNDWAFIPARDREISQNEQTTLNAVFVYKLSDGNWNYHSTLKPIRLWEDNNSFGWRICASGKSLFVGAESDNEAGPEAGAIYIYSLLDDHWVFSERLVRPDSSSGVRYGHRIGCTENELIISSANAGELHFYDLIGNDWIMRSEKMITSLDIPSIARVKEIFIRRNWLFVSTEEFPPEHSWVGLVRAYRRVGDKWLLTRKFSAPNPSGEDTFGSAIILTDEHIFVGAFLQDRFDEAGHQTVDEAGAVFMTRRGRFIPRIENPRPTEHPILPSLTAFQLAYPNPAQLHAHLNYTVTDASNVRITLYDLTGRELRTELNTTTVPGEYTETIDVSDLPSGVYFYRISIGRLSATKPLTVVH